jgi:hypothetical protein
LEVLILLAVGVEGAAAAGSGRAVELFVAKMVWSSSNEESESSPSSSESLTSLPEFPVLEVGSVILCSRAGAGGNELLLLGGGDKLDEKDDGGSFALLDTKGFTCELAFAVVRGEVELNDRGWDVVVCGGVAM